MSPTDKMHAADCLYKNPLHLDVVDRYLRRMGDKTIPDEAPPSDVTKKLSHA